MSSKTDYISQMVSETFNHLEESNVIKFPTSGKDSIHHSEQLEMSFADDQLSFDTDRLCLVMTVGGQTIEIPANWGPFRWHDFSVVGEIIDFKLTKIEDSEDFLSILTSFVGYEVQCLHVLAENGYFHMEIQGQERAQLAA